LYYIRKHYNKVSLALFSLSWSHFCEKKHPSPDAPGTRTTRFQTVSIIDLDDLRTDLKMISHSKPLLTCYGVNKAITFCLLSFLCLGNVLGDGILQSTDRLASSVCCKPIDRFPERSRVSTSSLTPYGHITLPWKGLVAFTARFRFERGTQARSIFSIVRNITTATARRSADFTCRFTLDEVSELNRDASAALATIREWMNSLASINRLPLDILSLIPTHLASQNDRFRATFVCRHWRRTFLQNATLWSRLYLSKGEVYVKTLLKRAKGSPLTILASRVDPVDTVVLLLPHTKQIANLELTKNCWANMREFSEIDSGPLPLLRTLNINIIWRSWSVSAVVTSLSHPLFSGAANLKEFRLYSEATPFFEPLCLSKPHLLRTIGVPMGGVPRFRVTRFPRGFVHAAIGAREDRYGPIARRHPSGKARRPSQCQERSIGKIIGLF